MKKKENIKTYNLQLHQGRKDKYHPIWINTHFNHPREITSESMAACEKIVNAGIPLGNQSVLLKGVNDDAKILK